MILEKVKRSIQKEKKQNKTPMLDQYSRDLTQIAREGKLRSCYRQG